MAEQIIDNLAEPFDPGKYTDDYRSNLMKIIKAKMKGKKIKLEAKEAAPDTGVLDLMSKLRASLEQGSAKKPAKKRSTARRSGSSRTTKRKTA
jgi:DNA end-binding protein Ku